VSDLPGSPGDDAFPDSRSQEAISEQLQKACEIVDLAWADLPSGHRSLLEAVGASQYGVTDEPLGQHANRFLLSAGSTLLSDSLRDELDRAVGVWVPQLRIVLINATHDSFAGLDEQTYEGVIAWVAWHEWGHALSIERATTDDVSEGLTLLGIAPAGIAARVRQGGYRRNEYTHEIVAEVYSMLMLRLRHGADGRPSWLDERIYEIVRRVTGWTT
jgi:hypothetical protein